VTLPKTSLSTIQTFGPLGIKTEEPIHGNLNFKEVSIACIETCLMNVRLLKITSAIGLLSVIGASILLGA
jgi:hypothetical protein